MTRSEDFRRLIDDSSAPVELRVKALELSSELSTNQKIRAETSRAGRRAETIELIKLVANPATIVAAIGIITLLITNSFNGEQARINAANNVANTQLQGQIDTLKAEQAATSVMALEERKFQFEMIKTALADSKLPEERAKAMLFLTDIGIVDLDAEALEKLKTYLDDPDRFPSFGEGPTSAGAVVQVPRLPVDEGREAALLQEAESTGTIGWMKYAIGELGVQEAAAADSSADIMRYAEDLHLDVYDRDDLDWSGLYIAWVLTKAGYGNFPSNILMNRAWAGWGRKVADPTFGGLAVFWRESPTGLFGHTGFIVGYDQGQIEVIGGNQNNAVTLMKLPRNRLLAVVMPE